MPVNYVAEQVFGTLGTVCWTGQILPQIWKSWREKSTEGLSHWLMLIWGTVAVPLGVFAIVQNLNIPLIIQPQVFGFLSIVSWSQCLYYGQRKSLKRVIPLALSILIFMGGFEAGMVFAIKPATRAGNLKPLTFFGVMSSVQIALGLLPQYYEIYKFGEVKGISMFFMAVDILGGVFSLLSLVFKEDFDVLAGVAYSLVVVLDGVVVILAIILNPRANRKRRRLAEQSLQDPEANSSPSLNRTQNDDGNLPSSRVSVESTIINPASPTALSTPTTPMTPLHVDPDEKEKEKETINRLDELNEKKQ
ncbi:pq loop repeat protein [Pyrrhoderma noxium]|uniref:Pq loop repeat protein n=1 Tax=Pyrrhoderma noxium TaxID=2282107 RepID=A0A286UIZ1_9AGAM|nr:pq loop repeat protein [Pyrrhoderma noxium]